MTGYCFTSYRLADYLSKQSGGVKRQRENAEGRSPVARPVPGASPLFFNLPSLPLKSWFATEPSSGIASRCKCLWPRSLAPADLTSSPIPCDQCCRQQPKLPCLPAGQRGEPNSSDANPGTGRTPVANHRRGHFQDRARQLTSSASGRAILCPRRVAGTKISPIHSASSGCMPLGGLGLSYENPGHRRFVQSALHWSRS